MIEYTPFLRLNIEDIDKDWLEKLAYKNLLPEIGLFLALFASYIWWPESTGGVLGRLVFTIWIVISYILFMLLITNLKTKLLPNKILYPLGVIALIYSMLFGMLTSDAYYLIGGIGAGILLASIPYLMYVYTRGKIIGFGNVRTALVAGIILGPVKTLVCSLIILAIILLVFILQLIRGKFSVKVRIIKSNEVGIVWATAIILSTLFTQYLFN